ncbi:MAG: M16 family metallopeptidase [Kofleriaceae bacterium]
MTQRRGYVSIGSQLAVLVLAVACGSSKPSSTVPAPPGSGDSMADQQPAAPPPGERPRAIEAPALLDKPLAQDPSHTTIHRLSNGMTVFISPDPQKPSIVAYIAVRAGSASDPKNSTGLAHYLEHMVFKGTSKLGTLDYAKEKPHLDRISALYADLRKPGANADQILKEIDAETQKSAQYAVPNELDQLYARMGITGLNAFTADDATVYTVEIPKNRIAQWARVEAARYSDPVFRLFWPELEAVYEEKNRGLDNPARRVNEALMLALFPNHGYGYSSGIGEVEHLKKPAYGDMEAFFHRYYTPQNMAIFLAGDVDTSVLPVLERELASFKRAPGEAADPGDLSPLSSRIDLTVKVPSDPGVLLAWRLVPQTHPDRIPLEVMDLVLLDGTSGILSRDLLIPQKVADAGCNPSFLRDAGYYELHADLLAGQSHAEAEKLLMGLVAKLKQGDFTDKDIATAVLHAEIREQQQLESNEGRMGKMIEAFMNGESWAEAVTTIDRMRKVTRADVMRVAKQYLTDKNVVIQKVKGIETPPKITKPAITPVKVDPSRQSEFARSILAMPVTPIEPVALREGQDYTRSTIATGDLVTVPNTRNGLFAIEHEYDFGRTHDRFVCFALDMLKVSGAGKRTAEQFSRELHDLGVVVQTSCTKDSSSIYLSGIDRNLEAGMALVREQLANPVFDDATIRARVATSLTERANIMANPQSIAGAMSQFARFGTDNEFLVVPSNAQLKAVTAAQIKKSLAGFLKLKHRTSYFGPRAKDAAAAAVVLGDGKQAAKPRKATRFRKPNTVLATNQDTAQTHVWLVWPKKPANDNDRASGMLFAEYMSPVLYQEVREARGLAYTVFGGYTAGAKKIDDASAYAYVGTQGDKTQDAIEAILSTIGHTVDDHRLAQAKETIAQNHRVERIDPRAIANVVYAWQDQGEKADPRAARVERALKLDRAALESWVKSTLSSPVIVAITGNKAKLDEAKLKKLAPVTFVPTTKLFGY